MNDRDSYTCDAMEKWGGSFVKALGNLARHSDPGNLERVKATWSALWQQYEDLGMKLEAGV